MSAAIMSPARDARVRVLHVINTLRAGGAEMNVIRLARHMDARKVEPHVAFCGRWPLERVLEGSGIPMLRLDSAPRRVRSLATPRIIARLMAYIRRHEIDLVHTHLFNAHAWGAVAARLCRTRLLEHVHDHRYTDRAALARLGFAVIQHYDRARYLARLSDHIVVLTRQNRDYVLEHVGIPLSRVSIIPNGLPQRTVRPGPSERSALRASLGIPAGVPMVLAVGRLASEKNFKILIAALERARAHVPTLHAFILGEGPDRSALERDIVARGLVDVIRLPGHVGNTAAYYDCADVFVQPSIFELQSLAMLEAMQAGLPAVVSAGVGCNDELITPRKTGLLIDPNRPADWADAIVSLLRDADSRELIGEAGRALVLRECDIREVARRFERLYAELCGR
jgi:glycosyltransferase involved in cell wall biosynthesis